MIPIWFTIGDVNLDHWLRNYLPAFFTGKLLIFPLHILLIWSKSLSSGLSQVERNSILPPGGKNFQELWSNIKVTKVIGKGSRDTLGHVSSPFLLRFLQLILTLPAAFSTQSYLVSSGYNPILSLLNMLFTLFCFWSLRVHSNWFLCSFDMPWFFFSFLKSFFFFFWHYEMLQSCLVFSLS